ncbi:hypothetical protein BC832DRAFT_309143 [Gaertneriomyces semiglobifer]|nr:hypothetical protein BC832DRAFT_309143 [Gaertneriomyces semiglobifer]
MDSLLPETPLFRRLTRRAAQSSEPSSQPDSHTHTPSVGSEEPEDQLLHTPTRRRIRRRIRTASPDPELFDFESVEPTPERRRRRKSVGARDRSNTPPPVVEEHEIVEPPVEEKPYHVDFPDLDIGKPLKVIDLDVVVKVNGAPGEEPRDVDVSSVTPGEEKALASDVEAATDVAADQRRIGSGHDTKIEETDAMETTVKSDVVVAPSAPKASEEVSLNSVLAEAFEALPPTPVILPSDPPAATSAPFNPFPTTPDALSLLHSAAAPQPIPVSPPLSVPQLNELPPIPPPPTHLPKPVFRHIPETDEDYLLNSERFKMKAAYLRHIEPSEQELAERVEYDMDEQDLAWLELVNDDRRKEGLGLVELDYFEKVMDLLEKEWFDLTKDIVHARDDEGDPVCAVCDDGECDNANAIVFCDGCNIAVHQDCYGIPYIPEGQWLCRKCMLSPHKPVNCVLCPHEDGAFKQTSGQGWAHLLCAMWIPECGIGNYSLMEPIVDIDKIPKSRWRLQCYLCHKKGGAPIQCTHRNCYSAFHPTCARKAKLYMRMQGLYGAEHNSFKVFCDKHTPPAYKEEIDVETTVQEFQKEMLEKSVRQLVHERGMNSVFGKGRKRAYRDLSESDDDSELIDTPIRKRKKRSDSAAPDIANFVSPEEIADEERAAALARHHQFSAPIPMIPAYILHRVLERLKEDYQELKRKSNVDFERKYRNFVIDVCKYWSLKRESRRGAPLLKRLHLEPWTASASVLKEDEEQRAKRMRSVMILRTGLEKVRLSVEQVQKRERFKLRSYQAGIAFAEYALFPLTHYLRPVLETIKDWDNNGYFAEPVSELLAPDYRDYVSHPMDFATMQHKFENYEYRSMEAFAHDLDLIWQNCMIYNKPDTPYYRTAQRLQKKAQPLLEEAKMKITGLRVDKESGSLDLVPMFGWKSLWTYGGDMVDLFPKPEPEPEPLEEPAAEELVEDGADGQDDGREGFTGRRLTRAQLAREKAKEELDTPESPASPPRSSRRKGPTEYEEILMLEKAAAEEALSQTHMAVRSQRKAAQVASEATRIMVTPVRRKKEAENPDSVAKKSESTVKDDKARKNVGTPKNAKGKMSVPEPPLSARELRAVRRREFEGTEINEVASARTGAVGKQKSDSDQAIGHVKSALGSQASRRRAVAEPKTEKTVEGSRRKRHSEQSDRQVPTAVTVEHTPRRMTRSSRGLESDFEVPTPADDQVRSARKTKDTTIPPDTINGTPTPEAGNEPVSGRRRSTRRLLSFTPETLPSSPSPIPAPSHTRISVPSSPPLDATITTSLDTPARLRAFDKERRHSRRLIKPFGADMPHFGEEALDLEDNDVFRAMLGLTSGFRTRKKGKEWELQETVDDEATEVEDRNEVPEPNGDPGSPTHQQGLRESDGEDEGDAVAPANTYHSSPRKASVSPLSTPKLTDVGPVLPPRAQRVHAGSSLRASVAQEDASSESSLSDLDDRLMDDDEEDGWEQKKQRNGKPRRSSGGLLSWFSGR